MRSVCYISFFSQIGNAYKASEVSEGSDEDDSSMIALLPAVIGCVCAAVAIALIATGAKYYHSRKNANVNTVIPMAAVQVQVTSKEAATKSVPASEEEARSSQSPGALVFAQPARCRLGIGDRSSWRHH